MLRIHLLGRPRLFSEGDPVVASGRPKVLPLLAYLLLHRDAVSTRERIAAALWPDQSERDARSNLRRHLNYLNDYLPQPDAQPWVIAKGGTLQWNSRCAYWFDVAEFERCSGAAESRAQAVELYDGDLLTALDEEWLLEPRNRLARTYELCLSELVGAFKARRDFGKAIAYAQRLLDHDPWREDILRQLMVLRTEAGDKAGALQEYERFACALKAELGTEPMPETAAVQHAILHDVAPPGSLRTSIHVPQGQALDAQSISFVGRDAEMRRLQALWLRATAHDGTAVLIAGEAGIGKTRLTRELAASCESQGGLVLAGSSGFPEAMPYEPCIEIARSAMALQPHIAIDPVWLAVLQSVIPQMPGAAPKGIVIPPLDASGERQRLFEAFAQLFEGVCALRPLLLIVEDLHWSGSSTIALVQYLGMRMRKNAFLMLATYREDESAGRVAVREIRNHLERHGAVSHIALGRLKVEDVQKVVGDAQVAATLHSRSGGNPFFLLELLRESGGGAADETPLSPATSALVATRVEKLGEQARVLAEIAATAGLSLNIDVLREVTGWLEAAVLDGVDELISQHILAEHTMHRGLDYAFSHQLIQEAIYRSLDPAVRRRRHRRIAQVMQRLYRDDHRADAETAFHWERAGEARHAAQDYFNAAKLAHAQYAGDEAREYVEKSLELETDGDRRFEPLLLRERLAALRGDRAEQAKCLEELSVLVQTRGDGESICTVLRRRIDLANLTGRRNEERTLIAELLGRAQKNGDAKWELSAVEAEMKLCRSTGDFQAEQSCFERMSALSALAQDKNRYAEAYIAHADALVYQGRLGEARQMLAEVLDQIDMSANRAGLVRTLMAFSRAALAQQDYPSMTDYANQALEISREIGDREGEALALHNIANGNVYTFRVEQAQAAYDRAMELYQLLNHGVGIAGLLVDRGLFLTELGLLDEAAPMFERAAELAQENNFPWVLCVALINAAYCDRLRGRFESSKAHAAQALVLSHELGSVQLESAALGTLGAAERELGDLESALEHLERGVQIRRPAGATPRLGDNLCALALAHMRKADLKAALRNAAELVALYDANPKLAPQPAEWLWTAAQVYGASGDRLRADALVHQAQSIVRARAEAIPDAQTRAAFLVLPFNAEVRAAHVTAD